MASVSTKSAWEWPKLKLRSGGIHHPNGPCESGLSIASSHIPPWGRTGITDLKDAVFVRTQRRQ